MPDLSTLPWGIKEIQEVLPHRHPFLLIDRVTEVEPGVRALAFKAVTFNEPYFPGHFPGQPVMPGVLQVEALAQTGAIALLLMPDNANCIPLFGGIDDWRFRRPVVPGDTLRFELEIEKLRGKMGWGRAKATVEDQVTAEGRLSFVLQPRN